MIVDSNIAAWWGAVLATVVLIWDVVKWSRDRPRVRISARMPVAYSDSERIETKTPGGEVATELRSYCHIEIINKGNMPTTIISVCCSSKPGKIVIEHSNHNITIHDGNKLPHVLGAGQLWSCRIPESAVQNIANQHSGAYVKVRLSHKNRSIYTEVKKG